MAPKKAINVNGKLPLKKRVLVKLHADKKIPVRKRMVLKVRANRVKVLLASNAKGKYRFTVNGKTVPTDMHPVVLKLYLDALKKKRLQRAHKPRFGKFSIVRKPIISPDTGKFQMYGGIVDRYEYIVGPSGRGFYACFAVYEDGDSEHMVEEALAWYVVAAVKCA